MIERLRGALLEVAEGRILLEVRGVGFRVHVSTATSARLPGVGEEVRVVARMLLHREEAVVLYGFATTDEAELFDRLRAVSGVGPAVALHLLALSPVRLRRAIRDKDVKPLQAAPCVGPKLARRLITELADALPDDETPATAAAPAPPDPRPGPARERPSPTCSSAIGGGSRRWWRGWSGRCRTPRFRICSGRPSAASPLEARRDFHFSRRQQRVLGPGPRSCEGGGGAHPSGAPHLERPPGGGGVGG